jgi:hypothetical protein
MLIWWGAVSEDKSTSQSTGGYIVAIIVILLGFAFLFVAALVYVAYTRLRRRRVSEITPKPSRHELKTTPM